MKKINTVTNSPEASESLAQALSTVASGKTYDWAKAILMRGLDPAILALPLQAVTPDHLNPAKLHLTNASYAEVSLHRLSNELTALMKKLISRGLSSDCRDVFRAIASKAPVVARKPISRSDLLKMQAQLPNEPFAVQLLFWLGLSGGPMLADAAYLRREDINLESGLVRFSRTKTGHTSEFFLMKPGLDLLKSHHYEPGEMYVFPEFVYSKNERNNHNPKD